MAIYKQTKRCATPIMAFARVQGNLINYSRHCEYNNKPSCSKRSEEKETKYIVLKIDCLYNVSRVRDAQSYRP